MFFTSLSHSLLNQSEIQIPHCFFQNFALQKLQSQSMFLPEKQHILINQRNVIAGNVDCVIGKLDIGF